MVASPLAYSDYVFINYPDEYRDFAIWLYQRLLYAGIPAWIDMIDIIPPAGYSSSVNVAAKHSNPMLVILSPTANLHFIQNCLELSNHKAVIVIVFENAQIPDFLKAFPVLHFSAGKEGAFFALLNSLKEITDYPPIESFDGIENIDEGIKRAASNETDSALYYFLESMKDLENPDIRILAIKNLGKLRSQTGMIRAAMHDPHHKVRSEAGFAAALIGDESFIPDLQTMSIMDESETVRLHAQIALLAFAKLNAETIMNWINRSDSPEIIRIVSWSYTDISYFLKDIAPPEIVLNSVMEQNLNSHQIFISYARRDAEQFSLELAKRLEDEQGFTVWIDNDLEPGSPVWMHEIQKAIANTEICLFVISPAMNDSEWVPREWQYAIECRKEIIPIIYLETKPIPLYLNTGQGLRPNKPFNDQPDEMFQVLSKTLKKKLKQAD
ncbi:TIR domain-containing protein [Candidatus Parcubacteria bacterium]|nr:TIR domain-containing protein [Candidatus Parcubacteria bacterium]